MRSDTESATNIFVVADNRIDFKHVFRYHGFMFAEFFDDCVGSSDANLDERLRTNELELRRLMAERAALVAVSEDRAVFAAEHLSMAGYLRATVNCSTATTTRDRRLSRVVTEYPAIGEALHAGHVTVDHALQIGRLHQNPRVRPVLPAIAHVLAELAEHSSYDEFADRVTALIADLDQDGAFDDLKDSIEGRRARVAEVGGEVAVTALGGDPVQAAQMTAIFEAFVEAEYRRDVETRKELYGDDADAHPLPRTASQRAFDALFAMFVAAYASPDGRRLPDTVVNLVVDQDRAHDALATAGIILPNERQVEVDDDGEIVDDDQLLGDLAEALDDDPEAFLRRRCETAHGTPVHQSVILRAMLNGHVRRVVLDSKGVIVDYGTKQRLFAGLARQAAMLLRRSCESPGCDMPAAWSQVDHNIEWAEGGRTDQDNSNVVCGSHNRIKHRQRWRTRRDVRGRAYTIRADGTVVLPVGERVPDLIPDDPIAIVRFHIDQLRRAA